MTATNQAPDISVVIPVLNAVGTIDEQLDAVTAQEFSGTFEVVVVDNGSTDGTLEIVERRAAVDPRVRVVDGSAVRGSAAAARNLGVECARADRLACCDADDVVQPGWLAALDNALCAADAATGALEVHSLNSHVDPSTVPAFVGKYDVFGYPGFAGGNSAIHRRVHDSLGGLSTNFPGGDDSEFAVRLAQAGHAVAYVPEAVVSIRLRTGFGNSFRHARTLNTSLRRIRLAHGIARPSGRATVRTIALEAGRLVLTCWALTDPRHRVAWARRAGGLSARLLDLADALRQR